MNVLDYKRAVWEQHHYRFGLAGEGQADIIAQHLDHRRGRVLSVGCGPWPDKINNLSRHCKRLLALDKAMDCLRIVRGSPLSGNVALLAGDAYRLPLASHSVDHVIALGLFVYIREPAAVVSELSRVCRPGGFIMITNSVSMDTLGLRDAASCAGLKLLRYRKSKRISSLLYLGSEAPVKRSSR